MPSAARDSADCRGEVSHQEPRKDRHVLARAADHRAIEWDRVIACWEHRLSHRRPLARCARLRAVKKLVLEDQHGIVVAHGGFEDSLRVIGVRDRDHLDAGDAGEIALHALGVLRAAPVAPMGRASPSVL